MSKVPKLVFTNVVETSDPLDFTLEYAVPGPLGVYYPDPKSGNWIGPVSVSDLSAAALGRARQFGIASKDAETAYLELRARFEQEEIELPVLSIKVAAGSFLQCAFLLSIGLSAWASFLLRMLKTLVSPDMDEPWILVEPIRTLRRVSTWDRPVAALELTLFFVFHLSAMATPSFACRIDGCFRHAEQSLGTDPSNSYRSRSLRVDDGKISGNCPQGMDIT